MDTKLLDAFSSSLDDMRKVFLYSKFQLEIPRGELNTLDAIQTLTDDGKKVTTSSLSELLMISKPAISQAINTLEKKKWVRRDIDETDKRVYCLSLTEEGKQKLDTIHQKVFSSIGYLLDKLGEEDTKKLIEITQKAISIIDDGIKNNQF